MVARHEASLLLCLDRLPMMDISKQFQSMTRDDIPSVPSVALPPLFEHNQINNLTIRYGKRNMVLGRSMRQDRDQANTVVAQL
jgi:hypothetical protein